MSLIFDKVYFRDILLRDKGFLYALYKNDTLQNRQLILGAELLHLNTLIKLCHLILNNEIPIYAEDITKIKAAKKFGDFIHKNSNLKNCSFIN